MDDLTLIMFVLAFLIGFIFFLLGFFELKKTFQEKDAVNPAMGFMYFMISMGVWFALFMWWYVMSTDAVLSVFAWFLFGFGWLSLAFALTCIAFMLKASVNKSKDGGLSLEFNEGAAT